MDLQTMDGCIEKGWVRLTGPLLLALLLLLAPAILPASASAKSTLSKSGHSKSKQRATPAPKRVSQKKLHQPSARAIGVIVRSTRPSSSTTSRSKAKQSEGQTIPQPKKRNEKGLGAYKETFKWRYDKALGSRLPDVLKNRAYWEDNEFLASYLAMELLFHPNSSAKQSDISAFLQRWPDHPMVERVKGLMDRTLYRTGSDRAVANWYEDRPTIRPASAKVRYLSVLLAQKRVKAANKLYLTLYRQGAVLPSKLRKRTDKFFKAKLSQADHEARAHSLLAARRTKAFGRLLWRFPKSRLDYFKALASAATNRPSFPKLYARLSEAEKQSSEIWEARFRGLRKSRHWDQAKELLMGEKAGYIKPSVLANLRFRLGRDLLHIKRQPEKAYALLQANAEASQGKLADSTWMAGWSAYLINRKQVALRNFQQLSSGAESRWRRSQGAFWAAKVLEKAGKPSQKWLRKAAQYPDTFYGLLAVEQLKGKLWQSHYAVEKDLCDGLPQGNKTLQVAEQRMQLLQDMGRNYYVGAEIEHVAKQLKLTPKQQICLAKRHADPNHAIRMGYKARSRGDGVIWAGFYPEPPAWTPQKGWKIHPALVWGTIRQESLFFHRIESSAGAMGLMQLMPATAREEAKIVGLYRSNPLRLSQPEYNMALGQSYLRRMLKRFDGDVVLALIAYNAGPGRANKWKKWRDGLDMLEFIENIPFRETRHYAKKVTHGMAVYTSRIDGKSSLEQLIQPGGPGQRKLKAPTQWVQARNGR
uniref:Putative GH23: Lytic transglycosylase n=1 Tax=Magnetococcus massalia (strain MO-1) TaxID=451514 RepID=A0A1S7LLQ3_MAGMO|nr:putative GH23 : Lytic transglycosylase [Candidatus Magnetococcus massalia]